MSCLSRPQGLAAYARLAVYTVALGAIAPADAKTCGGVAAVTRQAGRYACRVPEYSEDRLRDVVGWNCARVNYTIEAYNRAIDNDMYYDDCQSEVWRAKSRAAAQLCARALALLPTSAPRAAREAINAWGSVIMSGQECCTLDGPPYCADTAWSSSTVLFGIPFGILLVLLAASVIASWCLPRASKELTPELDRESTGDGERSTVAPHPGDAALLSELQDAWLRRSCLRALPGASNFAGPCASLFHSLHCIFDFQADNVRNQHEHLLSLWRSQCAMIADRSVEEGVQVDETLLLQEAVGDLHADLLDGFVRWRAKFSDFEPAGIPERAGAPTLGGVRWEPLPSSGVPTGDLEAGAGSAENLAAQLAEMVTYLLVWGEAGNVRFMPEVIYFITELALAADPASTQELYGSARPTGATAGSADAPFQSSLMLAKVIRPIYHVVFDEWYARVDIDPSNGRDRKKLHPELENFLPPDVANYDDWNEFFCDPARLVEGLLLHDGTRLFDLPHGSRFAALHRVDWQVSMEAAETKTHREVHSLWGVFASTHRVWLLHAVLFLGGVCYIAGDPPTSADTQEALLGTSALVRFAALGLLVPTHVFLRAFARWQVTGQALRPRVCGGRCLAFALCAAWRLLTWAVPIATYAAVRFTATHRAQRQALFVLSVVAHYIVSIAGLFVLLFVPEHSKYSLWALTRVPLHLRLVRYLFWAVVLGGKTLLGLFIFRAVHTATHDLKLAIPGHESLDEISQVYYSTNWLSDVTLWFLLWCTTFVLFLSDTQLWFTVASALLGVATVFVQRSCNICSYACEDAVARIPERFSRKVLAYSPAPEREAAPFSPYFPAIWDRIVEYMRYEDKVDNQLLGDLSFRPSDAGHHVYWQQLGQPLGRRREPVPDEVLAGDGGGAAAHGAVPRATAGKPQLLIDREMSISGPSSSSAPSGARYFVRRRVKVPDIFREKSPFESCFKSYCGVPDPHWPSNPDVQWRLTALARGLGLPMPRPFRAPYVPGLTVLIPHYGESIIMEKKELFQESRNDIVPLMDWLKQKYEAEFSAFTGRMQGRGRSFGWQAAGSQWGEYTDAQWEKIGPWSSMRMQTLWRTVAGMCLYHPALQCHFEAQADRTSRLAKPGVWDPSDCFTCLVSMQMYAFFSATQLAHTNKMFQKFPDCLKVAFIDCEGKGVAAEADGIHKMQRRRYFSCLIDKRCREAPDGRRVPHFRIELPGCPILGDGKGDNQNHAIPFMRGPFAQCIDANQGAYFEQMMLLPCVLGEFRSRRRGDSGAKRIVGFPEHITSDIGSIGDCAASAEVAFGTVLQRSYAVLGARMHYGHPDIMNKLFMMQQGGVSKATKTLNLSEDIFAGMDFTLRGEGRKILHREYFHLAKGRDLGFNTVLGFFSKLASGTGEQVLSRQTFRLGQVLHLPEALTFYYAHVGYYFSQYLVSASMPLLVFVWLLVLLSDCEGGGNVVDTDPRCYAGKIPAATVMSQALGVWFSWLLALFLFATSMPLFAEVWMEFRLIAAVTRFLKQMFTLSPLMFIFQAKIIGHYVVNEIRYGGATYVSTGRGLPTERRPFIGEVADDALRLTKVGGLYLDYAAIAYYDGATLLCGVVLVVIAGGWSSPGEDNRQLAWLLVSLVLTITSWLFAPFLFNPYQFQYRHFKDDMRCLCAFYLEDSGRHWVAWYDRTQLKPDQACVRSFLNIGFFTSALLITAWYATMNLKVGSFISVYSEYAYARTMHALMLVPPLCGSLTYCVLACLAETAVGCTGILRRRLRPHRRGSRPLSSAGDGIAATANAGPGTAAATQAAGSGPAPDVELGEGGRPAAAAAGEQVAGLGPDAPEGDTAASDTEIESDGAKDQAHTTVEDRPVEPAPPVASGHDEEATKDSWYECCRFGIPLSVSAVVVVAMDVTEASVILHDLHRLGHWRALMAGLILKWHLLSLCVYIGEVALRSVCFRATGCCSLPLQLWVRAHRMARDILTSLLISVAISPLVLLNSLNDSLCPGCSAHQLLIYRDPGHLARKEAVVVDILGDAGECEGEEFATFEAPAPMMMGPTGHGAEP